jgi:hypothetical protein
LDRFVLIIIAVVIIFSLLTYLLHRLTLGKRYIKYLLPLLALLLAIYYLYQSQLPSEGFKGIGMFLMALILFSGFLSSLVSGLFFDFVLSKLKKK